MKKISISKYKLRNFLAERATANILQADENDLFNVIRYDGIKGYEQIDEKELFEQLVNALPEFKLTEYIGTDNNHLFVSVKKDYDKSEDDILVDVTRIIQMKMLA